VIPKRVGKKAWIEKIESDTSSKTITQIEIQKEIDTNHIIFHVGFSNLLKEKRSNRKKIRETSQT
jgi:hypothetical protein